MVLDSTRRVVALAGGVGGAKLVYGLAKCLPADRLTIIGNVGDDFEHYGLHISPDLDTVMYTLAGIANPATGWGIQGDTGHMLDMMAHYGEDAWFRLGDRDIATHLLRTQWLREGMSLTEVTARLMNGLGVRYRLLPVTDDPLSTMVDTHEHGTLGFQEYFVRQRWQPTVKRVWYDNSEQARVTESVYKAVNTADMIVICPSNPVLSIAPLLAARGMRDVLMERPGKCVAVSPFIGGKAVKGPADKLMRELGLDISPKGLMHFYDGLLDGLVIDETDRGAVESDAMPVLATRTLMQSNDDKVRLAGAVLDWMGSVKQ